ncbi:MAG TPA: DUF512 domain-containing protein [Candidatus Krumholzibacterium sp.]|nr:DUF512 domain-containing protein [Candidatus Krumholzibacterium sp.]
MTVRIKKTGYAKGFFRKGDEILSIGGVDVCDQLDLFFMTAAEGSAEFKVRRAGGGTVSRRLRFETLDRARPVFEEMGFRNCSSRCVFCFVDQMPPDMRESLYRKDDDYRWSFLYGNYVTLNDVSDDDLERIVRYNLSPLYISVHATGAGIRRRLFGRPMKRDILEDLRYLTSNGVEFNAQIVLVPGLNDGKVLDRTVRELRRFRPRCRTLAIVPVGLTGFRQGLEKIRRFSAGEARDLVSWAETKQKQYGPGDDGADFPQLSDEFYLMAGRKLPEIERYGDMDQLSNGVGMCRLFLRDLSDEIDSMPGGYLDGLSMTIITGRSGGRFFRRYVTPVLEERLPGASFDIVTVRNRTFGDSVTVSGLLSGRDMIEALRGVRRIRGCVVLPANCINHDGLLIDGLKPSDIAEEFEVTVLVPDNNFLEKKIIRRCLREAGR